MFETRAQGVTVGFDLWYVKDDIPYDHLAAFGDLGYKQGSRMRQNGTC